MQSSTMSVVFLKMTAVSCRSLIIAALPRPRTTAMMADRRYKHTVKDRDDHDHSAPSSRLGPAASAVKTNLKEKSAEFDRPRVPKVMLLGLDNNQMGLMPFADAQHLAKQKNLKLVQVLEDSRHHQQPVYRLITGVQLNEERQKERELKADGDGTALVNKSVKTMIVGARIQKHDLEARMKTLQRWLTKGHIVRLTINGDQKSASNLENIFSDLEKAADEVGGQALQKRKDEENFTIKFTAQRSKKKVAAMQHKQAESEAAKEPKEET